MAALPDIEGIAQRLAALKRFVLLIGDAGALIVRLSGSRVESHAYFCGAIDGNIRGAKLALAEFPGLPVVIVYDVLGQAYRRDRLPPVNFMDRPKIMARKLETLFPGTELKGGLRLGASEGDVRGYDYLFAAVTASPEVAPWQKMLEQIENPISDVRLLPVESVRLLQRLTGKLNGGESKSDQWNILISQHRTGGFRQIVTRDHRLVIARMTSGFIDIESAEEIGSLLQREIGATIDYITRLGFDRATGLNAVFIGRSDIGAALKRAQLPVQKLTTFTPIEAGAIAGISGANDASGHYADLLHTAWGGGRLLPELSIWPRHKRQHRTQTLAQIWGTRALATASVAGLIYGADLAWEIRGGEAEYLQAEARNAILQQQYDAGVSKLDAGPVPIARMRDVISIHRQLEAADVDLSSFYSAIDACMSENVRLSSIRVQIEPPSPVLDSSQIEEGPVSPVGEVAPVKGKITLILDLSSYRNAELAVDEADRLANALRKELPHMQTTIIRQPLHILPADTFTVKPGENVLAFTGEVRVAEIELTGRLK